MKCSLSTGGTLVIVSVSFKKKRLFLANMEDRGHMFLKTVSQASIIDFCNTASV